MPSITFWTRLEPFTRLEEVDVGLQAQTHDPLWLLGRQWQTGEFEAEDAGTPVTVRLRLERAPLARYRPGGDHSTHAAEPYRAELPLEALVEREPVQRAGDPRRDLLVAAEAGLFFLRLLERHGVTAETRSAFAAEHSYALAGAPNDPAAEQDRAGARYLAVMAGRAPDGFRLYQALVPRLRRARPSLPTRPSVPVADAPSVIQAGLAFLDWFERRYTLPPAASDIPSATPSWVSERMEYSFNVSAKLADGEIALTAPEYPGGTLDWYSFDRDPALTLDIQPNDPPPEALVRTVIPAPVRYIGMAADRWWEFEDGRVNLSRIQGDPDELMRLLLVAFALEYSNDWYVVPVDLQPGALFRPSSLVVTDAFGERTLVPHYASSARAHPEWRLFALSSTRTPVAARRPADDALFLPPVLAAGLHGDPIEEVVFLRDEIANMVWAVERLAPSIAGGALNRVELYAQRPVAAPTAEEADNQAHYRLATTVPDYWIPFQPVRIDPSQPDIRLRRAAALLDEGDEPGFSRPLGRLLEPERGDLSIYEEEVPRSGLRLVRQYQHARWLDGTTFLWLARRKAAGCGEGSSGLRFDVIEDS